MLENAKRFQTELLSRVCQNVTRRKRIRVGEKMKPTQAITLPMPAAAKNKAGASGSLRQPLVLNQ